MPAFNQSRIIILSGPSGAGKSTVIKELLESLASSLEFSISTTTREKRPYEIEGKDYYFVTKEEFKEKLKAGEFIESAEVHGNFYGTSKMSIERILNKGPDYCCLLDIDVQGAVSLSQIFPQAKRIFLLPPSIDALKHRLISRGDTSTEAIQLRLSNAIKELSYIPHYNYFVVNTDPAQAVREIEQHIYGKQAQ